MRGQFVRPARSFQFVRFGLRHYAVFNQQFKGAGIGGATLAGRLIQGFADVGGGLCNQLVILRMIRAKEICPCTRILFISLVQVSFCSEPVPTRYRHIFS